MYNFNYQAKEKPPGVPGPSQSLLASGLILPLFCLPLFLLFFPLATVPGSGQTVQVALINQYALRSYPKIVCDRHRIQSIGFREWTHYVYT